MKLYVLQVNTGSEEDVQRELCRKGIRTLVPIEERLIRSGGSWTQKRYKLLPGYVFVELDYSDALYFSICQIPAVIRVLKAGGKPAPLPENEERYIHLLGDQVIYPSIVRRLPDGTAKPLYGLLRQLEAGEIHYDWHAKRATVDITLFGSQKRLKVSFRTSEDSAD